MNNGLETRVSSSPEDLEWDAFLESNPRGEYPQSSRWASVKHREGWQVERLLLLERGAVRGGAQVLWKTSRLGRIGYSNRGPLMRDPSEEACRLLVDGLAAMARRLELRALIVHCVESDQTLRCRFSRAGFLPNRVHRIITASWITPLEGGMDQVRAGMRRETRAKLRKAARKGVRVEQRGREDLGVFFELMLKTCERQGVTPNPGSIDTLEAVWDAFHEGERIRLGVATFEGKPVSAALTLRFGDVISIWKKGSDPEFLRLHPMEPVYEDALAWGCRKGARICDHGGLKRATAESLLAGNPLTGEMKRSRDFYNMRFGGRPVLLPEAMIYIPKRPWRIAYRTTACSPIGSRLLRRFHEC